MDPETGVGLGDLRIAIIKDPDDYEICIVSSELHGRDHMEPWSLLNSFTHHESLILCTDLPEKAANYFKNGCQQ